MPPKQQSCLFAGIILLVFLALGNVQANPPPSLIIGPVTGSITANVGSVSANPNIQHFRISGINLQENLVITAPAGFEVSTNLGSGYTNSVVMVPTAGTGIINSTIIYVRAKAATMPGIISGNITFISGILNKNVGVIGGINQTVENGATASAFSFPGCTYNWFTNKPEIGLTVSGTGNIAAFTAKNDGSTPITATIFAVPPTYAYLSQYSGNTINVIDLSDNSIISSPSLSIQQPEGIAVSSDNSRIYVGTADGVAVINGADRSLITTVAIPRGASYLCLTPDGSRLYVLSRITPNVYVIDTKTNTFIATVFTFGAPYSLSADPAGDWIYMQGNGGYIQMISTATNTMVRTINLFSIPASNMAVSLDGKLLYLGNINGKLMVIDQVTGTIKTTITLANRSYNICLSPDGTRIYTAHNHLISVFSTADYSHVADIPLPGNPLHMLLSADGKLLYALDVNNTIDVINTVDNSLVTNIASVDYAVISGNFIGNGACLPVSFTITVNPSPPTILTTGTLNALTTVFGTASSTGTFNIKGLSVGSGILVTPPTGFEVSLDGAIFTPTVTLGAAGNVPLTPVYIRLDANTGAGSYSGDIVLTSTGTPTVNLATVSSIVNRMPITITADNVIKRFGETLNNIPASTTYTFSGASLKNGNTITSVVIAYGSGATAVSPIGTYTGSVVPSEAAGANGFLSSNYDITYIQGDITVTAAHLTVTVKNINKTYGKTLIGAANSTDFTITGGALQNGNTVSSVTIAYGMGAAPTAALNTYQGSVVPSLAIGDNGFLSSNYDITYVPGDIIVDVATLTITPNNESKIFGLTLTNTSGYVRFTTTGLQNNETIGSISVTYSSGAATTYPTATYTGSVIPSSPVGGTFSASNYNIVFKPADIVVDPAPPPYITVTGNISAINTTYGAVSGAACTFNVSGTFMTDGILVTPPNGYEVSLDNSNFNSAVTVGSAAVVINPIPVYIRLSPTAGAGSHSGNIVISSSGANTVYVATDVSVVSGAPLTIAATNATKVYGTTLTNTAGETSFSVINGTLKNGNNITSISLNYGLGAAATDAVHDYTGSVIPLAAVGINGFVADNYNITYLPADIRVTAAPLTIVADKAIKVYGTTLISGPVTTLFTPTGLQNNETIGNVTLAYQTGANATDATGIYNAAVTPYLATGGAFSPGNYQITYVSNDIQVDRAVLTVIANNVGKVYGLALINGSASTGFNVQGLQNGETAGSINFFYAPGNLTTAPVGVYPGSVIPSALTGGTFNENNYTINYILGDLLISGAPLIIAVDNVSKVYGSVLTDGPTSAGFTAAGLQNGETIGSVTIATSTGSLANAPVGTYNGLVTATNATGTFAPGNYIITYTAGNITITPAQLVITAKNVNKIYRDVLTGGSGSNEFTSTPLPNGETVGSVTISYGNGAAGGAVIGSYKGSVVPSAATGSLNVTNYAITYIPGDLTVDPPLTPLILTFGSLLDLATTYGTPSTTTSLTISGTHMAGGILVTAPAGFEVSMDDNVFAQTITVGTVGSITNTKLYIRLAALASVGTYSGNVVMTSSGAIDVNEPLPLSKVSPAPLTIATINKTKAYGETLSNQAQSTEFTISGLKNSENVSSINLNYAVGAEVTAGVNTYIGSVMPVLINGANGFNVNNYNVTYIKGNIIVEPATITITARKVTKYYGAVLNGGPGLAGYIVTAGILKNNEKINSVTITFRAGASASDGAGNYAASVTPSAAVGSSGFANENYNITYIAGDVAVLPVTLTVKADDKIKEFGIENPLLTVKYSGFVNGENESVLSSAPFLITTAEMRSPIGQYPIYAGGASAANYDIKYLQGLLTISGDNIVLEIPNTITPNGDGINDTWNIKNLDAYPNTTVDIFDRSGHKVFTSVGYGKSWDGTFNGAALPSGVYYYVINTKTLNAKVVSGHITVLK